MLDGPGKKKKKPQVCLTSLLQSEVKIIHIIVQNQDGQNNIITFFQYSCALCFSMMYIIKWIYAKQLVLLSLWH